VLVNHQGVKTPTQPVECDQCDSTFANKYSLKKHVKKVHLVRQYPCTQCQLSFHKHHLLRAHLTEHTGALPWACAQCPKSFQYEMYLKRHSRRHAGYRCSDCGVTVDRWTDLQLHRAAEHPARPPPAARPCADCGRLFREEHSLRRHRAVHAETRDVFQCPQQLCPRYFYYKNNLAQHISSFHEGRLHECAAEGCPAKFYSRQKLREHVRREHEAGGGPARSAPVRGEARRRRKDKGRFKKPMAAVLTGLEVKSKARVQELLEGEVRGLDCVEMLSNLESMEAMAALRSSSEPASEGETVATPDPALEAVEGRGEVCGLLVRPSSTHFRRMWAESDTDTDTDPAGQPVQPLALTLKPVPVDFSKFMKK
jgi:hypothetical protein